MNDKITKISTNNIFRIILSTSLGLIMLILLFLLGDICACYLFPNIIRINRVILMVIIGIMTIPAGLLAGFLSLEKENSLIVLFLMTIAGAMVYILVLGLYGVITTAFIPLGVYSGYYFTYEWEDK